ncbi:MAG: hypothetical protein PHF21_03615 [Bacilli bacterium]|nr:hypothetical protein [Bacilli bacterium]
MNFHDYYKTLNQEFKEYLEILTPVFPRFLIPFIETKTMMRLKDIGYFCGMDYANKSIYNFKFYLSSLDHSISTALMVWGSTFDEEATLAALFHDASSPALRHVIDYLNDDHVNQESTEKNLKNTLIKDKKLIDLLNLHKYDINKISDFKSFSIVDSKRPKLCADRLDGIFLSSLVWAKNIELPEIRKIYDNIIIKRNENNEEEYSFIDIIYADRIVELNDFIDTLTHSDEDYLAMTLLSEIVKILIKENFIKYEDLYILTDKEIFDIINKALKNEDVKVLYKMFTKMDSNICFLRKPIKKRVIDPLILENRYSKY